MIYFDCVINETISVLARRAKEEQKRADQFAALLDKLMQHVPDETITWVSMEVKRLYPEIVGLVRETSGALNFLDALIAVICKEIGDVGIISFDEDFDQIGWLSRVLLPDEEK